MAVGTPNNPGVYVVESFYPRLTPEVHRVLKRIGFARLRDVDTTSLHSCVRTDEFLIVPRRGEPFGHRVDFDYMTYFVPDELVEVDGVPGRLTTVTDAAIVLSLSQLTMNRVSSGSYSVPDTTYISGDIVKVQSIPRDGGWYKPDSETGIPTTEKASHLDMSSRSMVLDSLEPFIGSPVVGCDWNVGYDPGGDTVRGRVIRAFAEPVGAFGYALKAPGPDLEEMERIA